MKKLIIVNNNMRVGGVQKSLYNLLWSIDTAKAYDVTLLLFSKTGVYAADLPPTVKVVECRGPFRFLGRDQRDFHGIGALVRGGFAALARLFGRAFALRLMLLFSPWQKGEYDCAVSFLHNGRKNAFYGGVQDYVLHRVRAKKKVAYLHCDYGASGADHKANNRQMARFNTVAACSDGCRRLFAAALPSLAANCVTVRNCHRFDVIRAKATEQPLRFDTARVHVVTVARLTHEKGVERAVTAVAAAVSHGVPIALHVVGDGAMRPQLQALAQRLGVAEQVVFYGEQVNPYRYMQAADLFLLTSYHEAAPMVIEEAGALGVPILTTATTSSHEMVIEAARGWVCDNSQEALNAALYRLTADRSLLAAQREKMAESAADNHTALAQFRAVTEN